MSLGRNILKILSSKVAVQLITFATVPILARIFTPEVFGIRQVFSSIFAILAVICCLRYELSIPLGRDKKEAVSSFLLSVLLTVVFSILLLCLVPLFKGKIADWYKMPELEVFLWLLPLFVLVSGVGMSLRYWAGYEKRFGAIAWAGFGSALGQRPVTLVWALVLGATVTALFVGAFGQIAVAMILFTVFLGRGLIRDIKSSDIDFKAIWSVAKRHKKFPILSSWSGFLNTFSNQLPVFILGFYFPKEVVGYSVVGYYFMAKSVVNLPIQLVGQSVSQVFYPTAAKEYSETGSLSKVVSDIFKRLVQIGVFPMVVLAFLGGELFGFVLGEKWTEAGVYCQILAPFLLFRFITSPWTTVFLILNRQGTVLILSVLSVIISAGGLILGSIYFSPRVALIFFTISYILFYIVHSGIRLILTDVSLLWAGGKVIKYIVVCSVLVFPVKLLTYVAEDWIVVVAVLLVSLVYIAVLLKADASLRRFVLNILGRLEAGKSSISKE